MSKCRWGLNEVIVIMNAVQIPAFSVKPPMRCNYRETSVIHVCWKSPSGIDYKAELFETSTKTTKRDIERRFTL